MLCSNPSRTFASALRDATPGDCGITLEDARGRTAGRHVLLITHEASGERRELCTDEWGRADAADLAPGPWTARPWQLDHDCRPSRINIRGGAATTARLVLLPR